MYSRRRTARVTLCWSCGKLECLGFASISLALGWILRNARSRYLAERSYHSGHCVQAHASPLTDRHRGVLRGALYLQVTPSTDRQPAGPPAAALLRRRRERGALRRFGVVGSALVAGTVVEDGGKINCLEDEIRSVVQLPLSRARAAPRGGRAEPLAVRARTQDVSWSGCK